MRAAALILALVLAAATAAAAAPAPGKSRIVVPPPARLRGTLGAIPSRVAAESPGSAAERLFLQSPIAAAPSAGAPQDCRLACAQTYYFCAASDAPEECPGRWALCRSGCDAPSPAQSFAPR